MSSKTTKSRRRSSRLKKNKEEQEKKEKEEQERAEQEEEEENEDNEDEEPEEEEVEDDEEDDDEQKDEDDEEDEDDDDDDGDYRNKLRSREGTSSNNGSQEQDMANLAGDIDHEYEDGECVWAKYLDYPWWPGQIEIAANDTRPKNKRRKNRKRTTITVRWFGEFGVKTYE